MTGPVRKDHNGQPTCCAPGDPSECAIETTRKRDEAHSKTDPPEKDGLPHEAKTDETAQRTGHERGGVPATSHEYRVQ